MQGGVRNWGFKASQRRSQAGDKKFKTLSAEDFPANADQNHPESTGVGPRPLNNRGGVRVSTQPPQPQYYRHVHNN